MKEHVTKNYFTDGGDTLIIGGKMIVEEGAEVEGLGGNEELPIATTETAGMVKQVEHIAELSTGSFLELQTAVNEIIQKFIAAGVVAAS